MQIASNTHGTVYATILHATVPFLRQG